MTDTYAGDKRHLDTHEPGEHMSNLPKLDKDACDKWYRGDNTYADPFGEAEERRQMDRGGGSDTVSLMFYVIIALFILVALLSLLDAVAIMLNWSQQ